MGGGAPEVEPAERSGHTRTCAHTSGTCAKRTACPPTPATPSASRGTPGRLLTLVSHTHILSPAHAHQAFYTLTRRRAPCAHTKDTPPCTHKARLALPTNSHSDIPQGHHGEGRAGHSPPGGLSPASNPRPTGLWQRCLDISQRAERAQPLDANSVCPSCSGLVPGAHQRGSVLTTAKALLAGLRPRLRNLKDDLWNIRSVFTRRA